MTQHGWRSDLGRPNSVIPTISSLLKMPHLIFATLRSRSLWRIALETEEISIGSAKNATVTVADPRLAAREVLIHSSKAGFQLVDLARRRTVYVNGRIASSTIALADGDCVRVGDTCFMFLVATEPSAEMLSKRVRQLTSHIVSPQQLAAREESLGASRAQPQWLRTVAMILCGLALGTVVAIAYAQLAP